MAHYNDNDYKFVAVLNRKVELPKLLNALGHISAGLMATAKDATAMEYLRYVDNDNTVHPAISRFPFIILVSENSNKIRTLRNEAIRDGIIYNDFVDSMLGCSAEEQMTQTRQRKEADLEYYAIVLFGESAKLHLLTKGSLCLEVCKWEVNNNTPQPKSLRQFQYPDVKPFKPKNEMVEGRNSRQEFSRCGSSVAGWVTWFFSQ